MAYFSSRNGRVRAHVCIDGTRQSRTFVGMGEAKVWADEVEQSIRARRDARLALESHSLGASLPRRLLHARSLLPHPEASIVAHAIPASLLSGVYFLIQHAEVVYVGQSADVFGRISKHLRSGRQFDSFNVIPCPAERRSELEALYIAALLPSQNTDLGAAPATLPPKRYISNADAAAIR
jgi:hypothetical protein